MLTGAVRCSQESKQMALALMGVRRLERMSVGVLVTHQVLGILSPDLNIAAVVRCVQLIAFYCRG